MAESVAELQGEQEADSSMQFGKWVLQNGGDEEIIAILTANGFCSKLSLRYLDIASPEGEQLTVLLNYGQKCLLQGLIKLALAGESSNNTSSNPYRAVSLKAESLASKAKDPTISKKLQKLFHFQTSADKPGPSRSVSNPQNNSGEEFHFHQESLIRRTGKGKRKHGSLPPTLQKGKGPRGSCKKVKEYRLKVVVLPRVSTTTPPPRQRFQKDVWVRTTDTQEEVVKKIQRVFEWSSDVLPQYMYAQGKCLRLATLSDVEGADSWDADALRTLMGSGCLYTVRKHDTPSLREKPESDSDEDDEEFSSNLKKLQEIFKNVPLPTIEGLLKDHGMQGALEMLISEVQEELKRPSCMPTPLSKDSSSSNESLDQGLSMATSTVYTTRSNVQVIQLNKSPTCDNASGSHCNPIDVDASPQSLGALLQRHADKMINSSAEYTLSVNRSTSDNFWLSLTAFYKSTKVKPEKLRKQLVIQYSETGEIGADSGALRKEFFEDGLKEVNNRLFEGKKMSRVPKKDCNLEYELEIAGCLLAHSVLQGGPGIPVMSEAIYTYLVSGDPTSMECYPSKDDIPLNIATHSLLTFIEKLDEAKTDDEVDQITDTPTALFLLNQSSWSITEAVTMLNKSYLLQKLIFEEVITRREGSLKAFRRGLNRLGLVPLLQSFPDMMKPLFVAQPIKLTAESFLSLIASRRPQEAEQRRAFDFSAFVQYLQDVEDVEDVGSDEISLAGLLRFCTGESCVPPMGLEYPLEFEYQSNEETAIFLKAQACFSKVFLPVVHDTREKFVEACIKSLQFGSGYGSV